MPMLDDIQTTSGVKESDRPYVNFETITIEDVARTKAEGVVRHKDIDRAVVTSPGGKSNVIMKMPAFWDWCSAEIRSGRCLPEWERSWRSAFAAYKEGREIPVDGTPILGWKLLTGAQQNDLIRMNIRRVEDLANLSDEGLRNIGMGGVEMKSRAKAWIAQNESKETGALRLNELAKENDSLRDQVLLLANKLDELEKALAKKGK